MDEAELRQIRTDLLRRFAAGEIDQATYDRMTAEAERLSAVEPPGGRTTPGPDGADTADPAPEQGRFPSIGGWATMAPQPSPARTLGGFQLQTQIGKGGMGEVWKAYDPTADRYVVVKVVPPELQQREEEMARVRQTFGRIHALQHEHICPVYLLGQDEHYGYFLVMKYIEGQTLSAYRAQYVARHGSFPVSAAVRVLAPVAAALDYAHAQRIVHRDIKPENILVKGEAEDVQVVDFGLAAEIRSGVGRVSQTRMDVAGTYPYMAPEQWRGELQDAATDEYALAVVAYELLAGHLPFDAPNADAMRLCTLNEPPPVLLEQTARVNASLARGMAKKREHRFASCRQLIEALHCGEESSVTLEPVDEADQASVVALELVGPPPLRPESVPDSAVCRSSLPKWLEEAGKGDRVAQYRVGTCYYNGWGVPADRDEAVRWFKMAAAEGHAEAQYRLANAYAAGEGAPLDRFEAARWYHRAAEQGHSEAQYHLGICYEMGNGVAANALEAAKWYYRAAQQGNRAARQRYGRLPWWATIVQGPWMDMLK